MNYRVVVDTNLIVSAVLSPNRKPSRILDAIIEGQLLSITSPPILAEARRVFSYPKLQRILVKNGIDGKSVEDYVSQFAQSSAIVPGRAEANFIENDPTDNMFLACAAEGEADFIISGDKHLTSIGTFQGIRIMDPANFLSFLESQEDLS